MIRTAVVLSARKEKDSSLPYPLMPYAEGKDECLLNRTINMLKDRGFDNIILVVGYKAEAFGHYADDIVRIVVNSEYEVTGSMASLALAAPYISEDFLVYESDIICEGVVVDRLTDVPYKNCLSIINERGSGDDALVEIDNGFVLKISKDPHQINRPSGEMIGVSKISLDTFRKMMLAWEQNNNLRLNYEYLFLDCTAVYERNFIKFQDLIFLDVDNQQDFRSLCNRVSRMLRRKEDPFDYQNIVEHLRLIFPDQALDQPAVVYIGGMTNRNFKVDLALSEYVLRIPGNATDGLVDRHNELINSHIGSQLGITPPVKYCNESTGIKLTDFVIGAETLTPATIKRKSNLHDVIAVLKKLHTSSVRLNNDFNIFHEISKYEALLREVNGKMYGGWDEIRPQVYALNGVLNRLGVDLRPCHNDLVPENFIKAPDGKMFLIDWEYSGINDPHSDLAALFLESDFSEEDSNYVLNLYFDGNVPDESKTKILVYKILLDFLWSIWTVIKEAKGDDFGSYGVDRYNRAVKHFDHLSSNADLWTKVPNFLGR